MRSTNLIHPDCLYQYSLHATHLAEQQQQQHQQQDPNPNRKPKQPDHPPVSFLTSYGDLGYALTPNGTTIALLNSQAYEFRSQSSSSPQNNNIKPISLKPRLDTNFCGYNHATHTPPPNTPLSFALVTLFHPENRVVTNQKIDPDPKSKSRKPVEEEPLNLSNIRITMALKGKFHYDGRNHATPFAVRGAFKWIQLKKTRQNPRAAARAQTGGGGDSATGERKEGLLQGVQGTIFGFLLPSWMRGPIGGPEEAVCCFISGCRMFGGEVQNFETVEGTFLEWATSDHFRLGLAKEDGFENVDFGAGQRA
jgi:hypothetical protein